MDNKIDIVITWVDGNDPKWLKERDKYRTKDLSKDSIGDYRFRDWDTLKYWFRSIEENTNFVRNIYFVTWGHVPEWLNTNHPQLKIINHADFIPKEYLPTYNSVAIELNFHRIPGLGKKFIYFNDDVILLQKTTLADYFGKNGKIKYNFIESNMASTGDLDPVFRRMLINTIDIINRNFKKNRLKNLTLKDPITLYNNLKAFLKPTYVGYAPHHFSKVFDQSAYYWLWQNEPKAVKITCKSKFRNEKIITPDTLELIQFQHGLTQYYNSTKREKLFNLNERSISEVCEAIQKRQYKEICFNDLCPDSEFESVRKKLIAAFEQIYPNKSQYEV